MMDKEHIYILGLGLNHQVAECGMLVEARSG